MQQKCLSVKVVMPTLPPAFDNSCLHTLSISTIPGGRTEGDVRALFMPFKKAMTNLRIYATILSLDYRESYRNTAIILIAVNPSSLMHMEFF